MVREDFSKVNAFIKHPQKCVVAVVKDSNDKYNMITLEWFMRTSIEPPMFAISIAHSRYSYECLQKNRFFNLVFLSKEQQKTALVSGSKSGRDIDKFAQTGEQYFAGRLAKYPILKEAVANFECKVITQVKSGDHTIYVGEIKHSWLNSDKDVLLISDLTNK
ncbi:MAG: flavin reductase family protein [Candidatus Cloacimonetes bacterium]|nr:flavin reductase family protein [Candidatus Cloacimonadota bacterium]